MRKLTISRVRERYAQTVLRITYVEPEFTNEIFNQKVIYVFLRKDFVMKCDYIRS